jgi:hypothetical protein
MRSVKGDATRPQVLVSGEIHGDERVVSYSRFVAVQPIANVAGLPAGSGS